MEGKETLTWEEFLQGCSDLEALSKDLEQRWELDRNCNEVGGIFLKYSCTKLISKLRGSHSPEQGQGSSTENPEEVLEESGDVGETELSTISRVDHLVRCEYHIVFSISYSVPVLFFNMSHQSGCLLQLDEVWSMFTDGKKLDSDMWSTVSQQDHPVLHLPFFTIHPCHTSRLMGSLWNNSQNQPLSYLVTWLSIVSGQLGLNIPNELGQYLGAEVRGRDSGGNQ